MKTTPTSHPLLCSMPKIESAFSCSLPQMPDGAQKFFPGTIKQARTLIDSIKHCPHGAAHPDADSVYIYPTERVHLLDPVMPHC